MVCCPVISDLGGYYKRRNGLPRYLKPTRYSPCRVQSILSSVDTCSARILGRETEKPLVIVSELQEFISSYHLLVKAAVWRKGVKSPVFSREISLAHLGPSVCKEPQYESSPPRGVPCFLSKSVTDHKIVPPWHSKAEFQVPGANKNQMAHTLSSGERVFGWHMFAKRPWGFYRFYLFLFKQSSF